MVMIEDVIIIVMVKKRVSGGGSSKIEVRCFSGSVSAARYFSANDSDSCNNNDV